MLKFDHTGSKGEAMLIKNANLITCDDNNRILSGAALKISLTAPLIALLSVWDPNDLAADRRYNH